MPVEERAKLVIALSPGVGLQPRERFLRICKLYLKKDFDKHESTLRVWQEENLSGLSDHAFDNLTEELERSSKGTPKGKQRRAAGEKNEGYVKLLSFLEDLKRKYS